LARAQGRVVIFAAGTGNPYFTSDTCAALRASEMACDAIFKGTKVDGVYCSDPHENPGAEHIPRISHMEVLTRDLRVMDATAISLARENAIPIVVFNVRKPGNFAHVVSGDGLCTVVESV
ncbi:MAG TPA: UMP kinase, partial [Rhodospirillaceae bacterium]|nr:UMP kinase [Rhodospirillaceae bacterium]